MEIENLIRRRRVEPNIPAPKHAPVPQPEKEPTAPAREPLRNLCDQRIDLSERALPLSHLSSVNDVGIYIGLPSD